MEQRNTQGVASDEDKVNEKNKNQENPSEKAIMQLSSKDEQYWLFSGNTFNVLFSFKHNLGLFLTFYLIEFPLIIHLRSRSQIC